MKFKETVLTNFFKFLIPFSMAFTAISLLSGCSPSLIATVTNASTSLSCKLNSGWSQSLKYQKVALSDATGSSMISVGTTVYAVGAAATAGVNSAILLKSTDRGENWSFVSSFSYVAGQDTVPYAITRNTSGHLLYAGAAKDGGGIWHWIVVRSTNEGATWSVVDDYSLSAGQNAFASVSGIVTGLNGVMYVTGTATDGTAGNASDGFHYHVILRKSTDGGATWSLVNDYSDQAAPNSIENAFVAAHSDGSLYQVFVTNTATHPQFVVRKSTNSGASWTVVERYSHSNGDSQVLNNIRVDLSTGRIYYVGYGGGSAPSWIDQALVRYSADNGATWNTYLAFNYDTTTLRTNGAYDIAFDGAGTAYISCDGYDASGNWIWYVLSTPASGTPSFSVSDYITETATPWLLSFDSQGDLFATGYLTDSVDGTTYWYSRRATCN